jgi:polyhydroxyalkanoate synthesis repressor PhaR
MEKLVFALTLHCAILGATIGQSWSGTNRHLPAARRPTRARSHMSEPRVIKKYPNRRLYDTIESRYITLADIRRLVVERIDFVVVDKKNNADITRSILLQVIAEQEHLAEPVLSQEFMVSVIRTYGTAMQSQVSSLLESSLKQLVNQQQQQVVRERVKSVAGGELPRARLSSDVMRDG